MWWWCAIENRGERGERGDAGAAVPRDIDTRRWASCSLARRVRRSRSAFCAISSSNVGAASVAPVVEILDQLVAPFNRGATPLGGYRVPALAAGRDAGASAGSRTRGAPLAVACAVDAGSTEIPSDPVRATDAGGTGATLGAAGSAAACVPCAFPNDGMYRERGGAAAFDGVSLRGDSGASCDGLGLDVAQDGSGGTGGTASASGARERSFHGADTHGGRASSSPVRAEYVLRMSSPRFHSCGPRELGVGGSDDGCASSGFAVCGRAGTLSGASLSYGTEALRIQRGARLRRGVTAVGCGIVSVFPTYGDAYGTVRESITSYVSRVLLSLTRITCSSAPSARRIALSASLLYDGIRDGCASASDDTWCVPATLPRP